MTRTILWSALAVLAVCAVGARAEKEKKERKVEIERRELCEGPQCPDGGPFVVGTDDEDDDRGADERGRGGRRDRADRGGMRGEPGRMGDGPRGMMMRRAERDPEVEARLDKVRDAEVKVRGLAEKVQSGDASAKTELRKALGALFDAKLALEEAMLQKMEKNAARMRARIEKKKAGREKMIDERLARMSGDDEGEW